MTTANFSDSIDDLTSLEVPILSDYKAYVTHGPDPLRFWTPRQYDLTKAPENYYEATHCSDAHIWQAAMEREVESLRDQRVFTPADLPP
ncbi:hypothetical protein H2248_003945, partial [Termitomyces sp. 'cryptogamus']